MIITASEGAELHLADLKTRSADFDPMTRPLFLSGTLVSAVWYARPLATIGARIAGSVTYRWLASGRLLNTQLTSVALEGHTPALGKNVSSTSEVTGDCRTFSE
jgi:hypothetical protein